MSKLRGIREAEAVRRYHGSLFRRLRPLNSIGDQPISETSFVLMIGMMDMTKRIFASPGRYLQGSGIIAELGDYLSELGNHAL